MAVVTKDFKVKHGLIVEGAQGTINNQTILTEVDGDAYILALAGGGGDSNNTPNTLVKRDGSGNFAASNVIVENELVIDGAGSISSSDGDFRISTEDSGDFDVFADDIVLNADDDFRVEADDLIRLTSENGVIHLNATDAYFGDMENAAHRIATEGYVDTAADSAQTDAEAFATAADTTLYGTVTDDIATAKTAAEGYADGLAVNYDAAGSASAAEAAANSYTDDEISELDLALKAYADQAESDAVTSANGYTDDRETAITAAYEAYADQAEVDAKAYADQKVTDLIGGAPGILDTLNELAEAIGDDANFITTIEGQIALKADLTYVSDELSDLSSDAQGFADAAEAAANTYTDGAITQEVADRNSAISDAVSTEVANRNTAIDAAIEQEVIDRNSAITTAVDAIDTDDIEEGSNNLYFTNQRAIDAVGGTIGDQIDLLTTDDIEEGATNLYFTDIRAKGSAADLIVNAIKTNITITGNEDGLTITAENGVADSTTTDLAEGTNLYFTDERAVSALEAVVPNFTEIDINSVATQVAATVFVATASTVTAHSFAKADYRSAEYLVKVAYGTHTEISKVLLTLDTSDNIAITEYGIVGTNGSASTISADVSGDDVRLRVTTNNNDSNVTVVGTLVAGTIVG